MNSKIINTRLADIGKVVQTFQDGGKIALICDTNVYDLYYEECRQSLDDAGFIVMGHTFPAGENNKNGKTYLDIIDFMAERLLNRSDSVIALGGGVTGDIAGFAASTYLRGIRLIQVPTTLLAMVDSSIGGKTGINLKSGKNLAGTFHMPAAIIHDETVLNTLSEKEWQNGFGEILKMGFIEGGKLIEDIETFSDRKEGRMLKAIISSCCEAKQRIVEKDEFDRRSRHVLNFGHTIAHAIEKLSGYEIKHGAAVAIGMSVMTEISFMNGFTSTDARCKVNKMLSKYDFDTNLMFSAADILKMIRNDKKIKNDVIDVVMLEDIGKCKIKSLKLDAFDEMLVSYNLSKKVL